MRFTADLPPEEIDRAKAFVTTVHVAKHDFFLRAGEVPRRIGLNVSGLLRLYYLDRSGKEHNKHFCVEQTCAISYSAFLQQMASRLSIQALEDCTLLVIDHEAYTRLLASHPGWQVAARKLAEMIFILKERREAELLQCTAAERYARFREDYPGLEQRVNQYQIASYLGITAESLSRIRRGGRSRPRRTGTSTHGR
jgi:CRP-like cAMP-binding protein